MSKRHLVLYGIGIVVLLAAASVYMLVRKERLSDMQEVPEITTTTLGTSTPQGEAPPAPQRKPFQFEIVTTEAAQAKGLGGRSEIPSNYGMLFVFEEKAKQSFWMKDMLASIDILWIADDGVVVGIEREVSPDTFPKSFISPEPVRYVLETRAGEAHKLGITVGTKLNLPLPYGQTVSE